MFKEFERRLENEFLNDALNSIRIRRPGLRPEFYKRIEEIGRLITPQCVPLNRRETEDYGYLVTLVAVWIRDKVIYDFPEVEITSFEMLEGLTDASEYLMKASEKFKFDMQGFEFLNDVLWRFDIIIGQET